MEFLDISRHVHAAMKHITYIRPAGLINRSHACIPHMQSCPHIRSRCRRHVHRYRHALSPSTIQACTPGALSSFCKPTLSPVAMPTSLGAIYGNPRRPDCYMCRYTIIPSLPGDPPQPLVRYFLTDQRTRPWPSCSGCASTTTARPMHPPCPLCACVMLCIEDTSLYACVHGPIVLLALCVLHAPAYQ